jgi:hypothetical protein
MLSVAASTEARVAPPQELVLALGGDVIYDAPIEYVVRTRGDDPSLPASYADLFEDMRPLLTRADLAIANLETPVGPRLRSRSEEHDVPTFAAPPAFLGALHEAGVDVVTVANNHAYDQGIEGLQTTLETAASLHLHVAGAIAAGPSYALVRVHGKRVAVVSLTQGTNWRVAHDEPASPRVLLFDQETLTSEVAAARAHADIVIVALHFTDTGDAYPTQGMRRWCERAAHAGADLVVGHGPHVPSRMMTFAREGRSIPAVTSLGNMLAGMQAEHDAERTRAVHVRDAVLAEVHLRIDAGHVGESARITPHPFWIDDERSPRGVAFLRPLSLARLLSQRPTPCGGSCRARHTALTQRERMLAGLFQATPEAHPVQASAPIAVAAAEPVPATTPTPARPRMTHVMREGEATEFVCGSAHEVSVDAAALRTWVEAMRAHPRAQLEVTASRCEGEVASLAERRARRAAGLIAVLGPSRSRFTTRVGEVRDARVTLRLVE